MVLRPQSAALYDVLSLISLAAVLGLIAGILLGAFALLLAGPAYDAESGQIKGGTPILRARQVTPETVKEWGSL
jgi:hypothetical protein